MDINMYKTISGIYENGQVILQESAPTSNRMKVLITFVEDTLLSSNEPASKEPKQNELSFSQHWQGQFDLNDKEEQSDTRLDYLKQHYQL